MRLKKAVTNDRSAAPVSGQVLGDTAPPLHINAAPRPVSPPVPIVPPISDSSSSKRQSVDWYASLAADQGVGHVPLPTTAEENEDVPEHGAVSGPVAERHQRTLQKTPWIMWTNLSASAIESIVSSPLIMAFRTPSSVIVRPTS